MNNFPIAAALAASALALAGCGAAPSAPSAATIQMPPTCTKPDGMTIDSKGRLLIAAPNNSDTSHPGAIFRIDAPGKAPCRWFTVPAHPETKLSSPMGITFAPDGALYVCDNQKDSKGRLLRITFKDDKMDSCETIAEGIENANGVKFLNGRLYLTQAFLRNIKDKEGNLASGLYMFNSTDRNVRVTNTEADPQLVFKDVTRNKFMRVGLNGVAVDSKGNIFVCNYGDGRVWKLTPGPDGKIADSKLFATTTFDLSIDPKSPDYAAKFRDKILRTPDGMCVDSADNVYIADMHEAAVVKLTPEGKMSIVHRNSLGKKDVFIAPSEPAFWNGKVYVSNYGSTTVTEVTP